MKEKKSDGENWWELKSLRKRNKHWESEKIEGEREREKREGDSNNRREEIEENILLRKVIEE